MKKYFFYLGRVNNIVPVNTSLAQYYSFEIWKPGIFRMNPGGGIRIKVFLFWWLRWLFNLSDYSVFKVYYDGKVIHRTLILPKYFKSPFMKKDDLQIYGVWTDGSHRGKGIASFAIKKIIELYKNEGRRFWYVVREENVVSRRLIEKFGFAVYDMKKSGNLF